MKKYIIIGIVILIAILAIIYIAFQPSTVSVYIYNINPSKLDGVKSQFSQITDNKLVLQCEQIGEGSHDCQGNYKISNLFQLAHYQNNLFAFSEKEQLDFSSFVSGSPIASLFD
jgi:LPS O-antigen subunit length determinant protein (WzzB/FepE family)